MSEIGTKRVDFERDDLLTDYERDAFNRAITLLRGSAFIADVAYLEKRYPPAKYTTYVRITPGEALDRWIAGEPVFVDGTQVPSCIARAEARTWLVRDVVYERIE